MAPESREDCTSRLLREFWDYDQTVDVVSCCQAFLNYRQSGYLTYFDRYPEVPPAGLTPDFTALLGDYGLVGEVKRTFPEDDDAFRKEIDQLKSYDVPVTFKSDKGGTRSTPKTQDIVLILFSPSNSLEIAYRIGDFQDRGEITFAKNLVLLEAIYDMSGPISHYVFRKIPGGSRPFRDTSLPQEARLEPFLGEKRKSINVYPGHFKSYKVREVFCNDQPPPLYTAIYLWTKVFYSLLTPEEVEVWRRGNPQKSVPVKVVPRDLSARINSELIPGGNVRAVWMHAALEFLEGCGLVTMSSKSEFEVQYRNLAGTSQESGSEEGDRAVSGRVKEYATVLARLFCESKASEPTKPMMPPPPGTRQMKLTEVKTDREGTS